VCRRQGIASHLAAVHGDWFLRRPSAPPASHVRSSGGGDLTIPVQSCIASSDLTIPAVVTLPSSRSLLTGQSCTSAPRQPTAPRCKSSLDFVILRLNGSLWHRPCQRMQAEPYGLSRARCLGGVCTGAIRGVDPPVAWSASRQNIICSVYRRSDVSIYPIGA
jgi:hypothetical protein